MLNADPRIEQVLLYWFGSLAASDDYPQDRLSLWFDGSKSTDEEVSFLFTDLVLDASQSKLDHWKETARGRLALILLLDQFPRHIYRGSSKAFSLDLLAQNICLEGIEKQQDKELFLVERVFFYLPLEHAENLSLQRLSLEKFHQLVEISSPSVRHHFAQHAKYAEEHFKTLETYGYFPWRP
jgi:uncharacterized protein (DUF924 family)